MVSITSFMFAPPPPLQPDGVSFVCGLVIIKTIGYGIDGWLRQRIRLFVGAWWNRYCLWAVVIQLKDTLSANDFLSFCDDNRTNKDNWMEEILGVQWSAAGENGDFGSEIV